MLRTENSTKRETARVGALIAAGGEGRRMGGVDKMFVTLLGKSLISYPVDVFQNCTLIHQIVIVLGEDNLDQGRRLVKERRWSKVIEVCRGGQRRRDSVARGLEYLQNCQWVVIHDGARPCLTPELIERGLSEALDTGAAVAAVPVKNTIKVVDKGLIRETPNRNHLWAAQTPQVFRRDLIMEAHRRVEGELTDDAAMVERLGCKVRVYMGSHDNIKVTTPEDLALAELILIRRRS